MITKQELKKVLQEHEFSEEQIERILNKRVKTLLKIGNIENIDAILNILLNKRTISKETIEGCLSVLARGKAKEIEEIFKVLDAHNISKETIEGCLYVLARGKIKKIKRIFEILDYQKVKRQQIEDNFEYLLLQDANEIASIFDEGSCYLKKYMQLKGIYNRIINKDEINEICEEKKINQSEFMRNIRGDNYQELYEETLKRKRGIYIGKSIPMQEEFISKNEIMLLELSRTVAKSFGYRYRMNDLSELESQALEIMITKCGDIAYNFEWNREALRRMIYKKVFNYLKIHFRNQEILQDFSTLEIERKARFSNMAGENDNELDLSTWNINEEQENILRYISTYLEEGYNLNEAIENVANFLNMEVEEVLEEVENIKEQNNENKIRMGEEDELS